MSDEVVPRFSRVIVNDNVANFEFCRIDFNPKDLIVFLERWLHAGSANSGVRDSSVEVSLISIE